MLTCPMSSLFTGSCKGGATDDEAALLCDIFESHVCGYGFCETCSGRQSSHGSHAPASDPWLTKQVVSIVLQDSTIVLTVHIECFDIQGCPSGALVVDTIGRVGRVKANFPSW